MKNKKQIFISIIRGYPKYFYNFVTEEHYHLHALKVAKDLGYEVVVLIKNEPGIIENDPQFDKENTQVIYYSNIFNYLFQIIKYSLQGAIFYVNSVEPQISFSSLLSQKNHLYGPHSP